ncbi:MAG: glycoside hydrolase family 15 protein [Ktedonobacterales bacterium]
MVRRIPFIPYPPIGGHGVTGDRRTAALVAPDGTIDWMCLPDYNGAPFFGALLDAERGGFWRCGPAVPISGTQRYAGHTAAVTTSWATETGELELSDLMLWPEERRRPDRETRRVLVRRLRCTAGEMTCALHIRPRRDFDERLAIEQAPGGFVFTVGDVTLGLWSSHPLREGDGEASSRATLHDGQEIWTVLALNESPGEWSVASARAEFEETCRWWEKWQTGLSTTGPRARRMEHSGLIIHLLGYAPDGSLVAAPTTSLPERAGGSRNYDYRYAWVRDASLSIAGLSLLGDKKTAVRYLDWLAGLKSSTETPLQVVYQISGATDLSQNERSDIAGYSGSAPVRFGNRAGTQSQLGSLGYLCDCALIHLEQGGEWKPEFWDLVRRVATYTAAHWHEPDSGIWELPAKEQYTSSKVMSWVVLDRALKIAARTGHGSETDNWREVRDAIHADVLAHGWSEKLRSFVQRYGSEALDGSLLLIPVMGFLPADDERVRGTIARIVEDLCIDGLVYRFDPLDTPVEQPQPMGVFEGSFLPCTFWLATAYALSGRTLDADAILRRAESLTQTVGLFAEEADARNNQLLGNYPLLFSQVEYIRAALMIDRARATLSSVGGVGHEATARESSAAGAR